MGTNKGKQQAKLQFLVNEKVIQLKQRALPIPRGKWNMQLNFFPGKSKMAMKRGLVRTTLQCLKE